MNTHRVTLDLNEKSYKTLRDAVESGEFASESEAIEDVITSLLFRRIPEKGSPGYAEYEAWLQEELKAAVAEFEANPSEFYTAEEVRAHLAEDLGEPAT